MPCYSSYSDFFALLPIPEVRWLLLPIPEVLSLCHTTLPIMISLPCSVLLLVERPS